MSKQTTLVIMAAGMGSRFGGGIKQLESVGPSGEIIMDYSVFDAIEAGFNKIVFIIRKDIEKDFIDIIGEKIEKVIGKENVSYVFQDLNNIPDVENKEKLLENRTKPWGTGQAILACRGVVTTPFAVINADDYYGKESFVKVHEFLQCHSDEKHKYCLAGFILKNTLSENGGVTRGICNVDEEGNVLEIKETKNIIKKGNVADSNGTEISLCSHVSMNMFGLTPEFIDDLESGFVDFLNNSDSEDKKCEYLLPIIIGNRVKNNEIKVKVIETNDQWFGVTYKEDKENVVKSFEKLIDEKVYSKKLFD